VCFGTIVCILDMVAFLKVRKKGPFGQKWHAGLELIQKGGIFVQEFAKLKKLKKKNFSHFFFKKWRPSVYNNVIIRL